MLYKVCCSLLLIAVDCAHAIIQAKESTRRALDGSNALERQTHLMESLRYVCDSLRDHRSSDLACS
jgi:hypothetical protein